MEVVQLKTRQQVKLLIERADNIETERNNLGIVDLLEDEDGRDA